MGCGRSSDKKSVCQRHPRAAKDTADPARRAGVTGAHTLVDSRLQGTRSGGASAGIESEIRVVVFVFDSCLASPPA